MSGRRWLAVVVAGLAVLAAVVASAASLTVTTQGLSGFKDCTLTAYPSSSTVDTDNYVQEDKPTTNNGSSTEIDAGSAVTKIRRTFIRFDLTKCSPAIAGTATIKEARLRLFMFTAPTATRTYGAYRVTTPCPEALATCWGQTTETWNNQPATAGTATSSVASGTTSSVYLDWTVTADVQAWVAGTASNYGLAVKDTHEDGTTQTAKFRSLENNVNTAAPILVITYQ